ncbi:MAG: hypothetical protein ACKOQ6_00315 [Bacteroidota bacterium]
MQPRIISFLICCSTFWSCYYDSVEELYPVSYGGSCDTTGSSYSADVQTRFSSFNCSACHSGTNPSAGINLSSADDIKTFINTSTPTNALRLMGAIRHTAGYVAMPNAGTKIDNCSANRIEAWILAGCPNN